MHTHTNHTQINISMYTYVSTYMLSFSAVRLRVCPRPLAHCRYFSVSNLRAFRDFFAEVAETHADYMQKKSRQCFQDFAQKTHN